MHTLLGLGWGCDKLEFLEPVQFLDGYFPFAGRTAVMAGFNIKQLLRLSPAEIFGAFLVRMLGKSPGHIGSNAGIKRIIRAQDNINRPIHCNGS